jgi:hypothetical protein
VASAAIEQANPQYNFTDPDSKIMLDGGTDSFVQGYNWRSLAGRSSWPPMWFRKPTIEGGWHPW